MCFWILACAATDVDSQTPADTRDSDSAVVADDTGPDGSGERALVFTGERPRNLLMITVDTLRRDYVGTFGGTQTPFLDQLMAEGVNLTRHQANSNYTPATVLTVLTGQDTTDLGFHPTDFTAFDDDIVAAHRLLEDRGYHTYLAQGSTVYDSFPTKYQEVDKQDIGPADTVVAAGLDFELEEPWFLHLHFMDPHAAYEPPEAYLDGLDDLEPFDAYDLSTDVGLHAAADAWPEMSAEEQALMLAHVDVRYAGEVRYFDDQLAAFFGALEARGDLDDTLVSLWSDHGETFGTMDLWLHGQTLLQTEGAAVASFWAEGLEPRAVDELTCHRDLLPTLFDALGLDPVSSFTGRVLGRDEQGPCQALAVGQELKTQQSVVSGDFKLYYLWTGERWLYDLSSDPDEDQDLYAERGDVAEALWELLGPEVTRAEAVFPKNPAPVDPAY